MLWYLSLDTTPAKKMLRVLELVEKGREWDKALKNVLNTKPYRYMLFAHDLSTGDIFKVMKALSEGKEVEGKLSSIYNEYKKCLENKEEYYSLVKKIDENKNEILREACRRASEYLPKNTEVEAKIYFVVGGSDAYGVNLIDTLAVVMNITHFLGNLNKLSAVLAHELHHKALGHYGREIYWRLTRKGLINMRNVYEILLEVMGEGIASLVASPYLAFEKYLALKESIKEEYRKVETGIIKAYAGKNVLNELYPNIGPVYTVGLDMSLKIETTLGKQKLVETLNDPTTFSFFCNYMRAVDLSGEGYYFSTETIEILSELKEKINNMI